MTKEDFLRCFSLLENEFGKQSQELKEIWYNLFKKYKKVDFEEAIKYYLERIKKLPVPAYIWEAMYISNKNDLDYKEGNE